MQLRSNGLEIPQLVRGQQQQLQMACDNLLRNALEALQQQAEPRRLELALLSEGQWLVVQVADNGPGTPSPNLSDLHMNSTKPEGMGVGLLMVQSIASQHHGALTMGRSAQLGGAEFRLSLPLVQKPSN